MLSICITIGINYFVSAGFDTLTMDRLKANKIAVEQEIHSLQEAMASTAWLLSQNEIFARAVMMRDSRTLATFAQDLIKGKTGSMVEFATIADSDGVVLARGHSEKKGDSVAGQLNVQKALKGEASGGIEAGTVVKFSLRAGQPVYYNNKVVGCVSLGLNLATNTFVDDIKEGLGLACTLFSGDTRVSTTITDNGKRAIGTTLDNQEILDAVLARGEEYVHRATAYGVEYDSLYWPIINAFGEKAGMLFIGLPRDAVKATESTILTSVLVITGIVVLLSIAAATFFARTLCRPIARATAFAQQVADGRLEETLDIRSKDEVGVLSSALNTMVQSLRNMIDQAETKTREAEEQAEQARLATQEADEAKRRAELAKKEGMAQAAEQIEVIVERLTAASEELSAQVEQSSVGAQRQKDRATETASAMEEMNASFMEVAKNASRSAADAEEARDIARSGNESVEAVVTAIDSVRTQAEGLQASMGELGDQAESIGRIMQVIEDIADQTNLLALNAAIEAARAGDAGRGFAVVADEVRKLAEKTMTATKEVGQSITAIQDGARKSVGETTQAVEAVNRSTELAQNSGAVLGEIVTLVTNTSSQITSIATAAEEQSATSEEINRAIDDINTVSTETAEAMSQSAQAVVELARQAQGLKQLVAALKEG